MTYIVIEGGHLDRLTGSKPSFPASTKLIACHFSTPEMSIGLFRQVQFPQSLGRVGAAETLPVRPRISIAESRQNGNSSRVLVYQQQVWF